MAKEEPTYRADSAVSSADFRQVCPEVVFYQLGKKFVDIDQDIPPQAQEVMYYAMSIGHHVGVIDCFQEKLRCGQDEYERMLELLEGDDNAHWKMAGILRSGEIQIDSTNLPVLLPAFERLDNSLHEDRDAPQATREWVRNFRKLLETLYKEPAAYLMGRLRVR